MSIKCLLLAVLILLEASLTVSLKFRSEKVNYIYEKALQHIADRKRLQKLEGELSSYDKVYMDNKAAHKFRNAHEFSSQMQKIDKKLVSLLEKYDLQQAVYAFHEKMKHKNEVNASEFMAFSELERFTDERLQKLWETAKSGKFSKNELIALHKELKDAEKKTKLYDDALNEMNRIPIENSIHFDETQLLDEKRSKLKIAHRQMSDHFDKLHRKIEEDGASPFENERVRRLWKAAQMNGNFSENDLKVMKDELSHFDKQLKKIAFHKMFENIRRFVSRKRPAVDEASSELMHKEIPSYRPVEKKLRSSQKVCLRCLAGEGGHITHVLSEIAALN